MIVGPISHMIEGLLCRLDLLRENSCEACLELAHRYTL